MVHMATSLAAFAVARRRSQRIGMVDEPAPHHGHGLEAAVRVLRESRHAFAVVHVPAVPVREVLPDGAPGERCRRPERLVAFRIVVDVMDAE
jgi:hypothetical protein